jgi:hypothetical protein
VTHRTKELAYWITEREAMRKRKEVLHHPLKFHGWSDDPAMGTVRYCNVRREDDKVTRWIAKHWRNPNATHPNLTLAMVMARMINWPPTLEKIGFPFGVEGVLSLGDKRDVMTNIVGKKWTSAYTISTCGRSMGKEDYVFDHVLRQVADMGWPYTGNQKSLEGVHRALMRIDGLGSFLAAQVIADLKNTPGHELTTAGDWWTWSASGPGSLRGLAAYYGTPATPSRYASMVKECYDEVAPLVEPIVGRLHMQDFQNCLCEFSKYMRVKEGDGRVRNKYSAT